MSLSSKPRISDPGVVLHADKTMLAGVATYFGRVFSEGYDHIDVIVRVPTGGALANTTLTATFYQDDRISAQSGSVDVEDVNLALGTAPKILYQSEADITLAGAGETRTFRCRTQGIAVEVYLAVDVAQLTGVAANVSRG